MNGLHYLTGSFYQKNSNPVPFVAVIDNQKSIKWIKTYKMGTGPQYGLHISSITDGIVFTITEKTNKGIKNYLIALTICEDMWDDQPTDNPFGKTKLYTFSPMDELAKQNPDFMNGINKVFLSLSLGVCWQDWCYKLVAGIINPIGIAPVVHGEIEDDLPY